MLSEAALHLLFERSAGSAESTRAGHESYKQQCRAGCGQRADTVGIAVAYVGGQVVKAAAVAEQLKSVVEAEADIRLQRLAEARLELRPSTHCIESVQHR